VDIHLSKVTYSPRDDKIFSDILQSTYIVNPTTPASPDAANGSLADWSKGGALFKNGDYANAIEPYQRALAREKKVRQLTPEYLRVLIDNLGMAYGITGKLDAAEEVFRYGLSIEPTYPLFHYNLACVYAERNDVDNAMKYLTSAFQYKANLIAGEKMPDPHADDSFQRFMKNEKFRKLIDSF
jgi:tetratricopeptide (TPR) repeat protein